MFIRILGTNGSGKTTVIKGLISIFKNGLYTRTPFIYNNVSLADKWEVPLVKLPILLLGGYPDDVVCGGADRLSQKGIHDLIETFILTNAKNYHIIAEGSIFSGTKRYAKLAEKLRLNGVETLFLVMSTTREECIRRVTERRLAKGKTTPLDTTNLDELFQKVKRMVRDAMERGVKCEFVESTPGTSLRIYQALIKDDTKFEF